MKNYIVSFSSLLLILAVSIFIYLRPAVYIPDDLVYQLKYRHNYYTYVRLLNKASKKDTNAIISFLKQDTFYDAAVNGHGWVITQLIKKDGDNLISSTLFKVDSNQKRYLRECIELGIEHYDREPLDTFISKYPYTCMGLGLVSE